MCVCGGGAGMGAYAASQTTVLHMKKHNQTESSIFVVVCVLCFQRQSFLTVILQTNRCIDYVQVYGYMSLWVTQINQYDEKFHICTLII